MNIAKPVSSEITDVAFSFYSPDEVKRVSVKHIVNPQILDSLNQPVAGGLYDPALGPFSKAGICSTCKLGYFECPGHFGHVELPCPVINPLLFNHIYTLMRAKCFYCHKLRINEVGSAKFYAMLRLLQAGYVLEAGRVDSIQASYKSASSTANPDAADDASGDEEARANDGTAVLGDLETAGEQVEQIETFMRSVLAGASPDCTKETTTLAGHERKRVIAGMLRLASGTARCPHCKGVSPPLRKDGQTKIFQLPLAKRQQARMDVLGRQTTDVLLSGRSKKQQQQQLEGLEQDDASPTADMDVDVAEYDVDVAQTVQAKAHGGSHSLQGTNATDTTSAATKPKTTLLTPLHLRNHLRMLFENEQRIVDLLYARAGQKHVSSDIFFLDVLPVPPTRFRPASVLGDDVRENPQNTHLIRILNTAMRIRELSVGRTRHFSLRGETLPELSEAEEATVFAQLISAWVQLQQDINFFFDVSKAEESGERNLPPGIKQVLEKKEGLFRKHMMGKRVNYAARSVISPDPNIETSEIGIPPVFAVRLTYPEPVTHYNIAQMRQAVINGSHQWPGATHVQDETGRLTALDRMSVERRTALANQLLTPQALSESSTVASPINKKVYRHIRNGDMLLVNRQPTLHKPSIMAHRARILPGEKTIRMHYANCNTYNADFDGDEMNLHFPQNEVARAEAALIASTDHQYLVPTDGSPLRGLIQDHVVAGVWMTKRDTFFTRDQYQQLLYGALRPEDDALGSGRILMVPPAIFKPVPLWTGKQVISTLLKNLTYGHPPFYLKSKAKVAARYWGPGSEEAAVEIYHSELVQGVIDKSQFGASAYGLVHTVYELYGPSFAGQLLSMLGRLFTKYLQSTGFTCRMDDLRLTEEGDAWRRELMQDGAGRGPEAIRNYIGITADMMQGDAEQMTHEYRRRMEEVIRDDEKMQGLDAAMKSAMNDLTSKIINRCIPDGLFKVFPENNMQMMTVSGAKGSNVNVSQISCCLGQQELEGRRVPIMISGKSLPSFKPLDNRARAGGYIAGRFLTGIRPQEYFFHCMAGREGLIDTAVKTSRSGYLQRCLVKHLEGLKVNYDHTVRDTDGSVLQFQYGEDALDVTKQKHMTQFAFAASNYQALLHKVNPGKALHALDTETAVKHAKRALKNPDKYEPTLSVFSPSRYLGSVSERYHGQLHEYVERNPDGILQTKSSPTPKLQNAHHQNITPSKFQALMRLKYLQSLVEPGEAVGVLAAQSVGEPSTQMTLNTFHFAGFGAKNVTLGIPRLREIVMTASSTIKTPTMTMVLLDAVSDARAEQFAGEISRLTLADVMDEVEVTERLIASTDARHNTQRTKTYTIHLKMFTSREYGQEYNVKPTAIERAIELQFVRRLERLVMRQLRRPRSSADAKDGDDEADDVPAIGVALRNTQRSKRNAGSDDEGNDDDEAAITAQGFVSDDEGDGDATDAKMARLRKEMASYDDDDEDEASDNDAAAASSKSKSADASDSDEDEDDAQTKSNPTGAADEDAEMTEADRREVLGRASRIIERSAFVTRYSFDSVDGAWCELDLQFPGNTPKLLMVDLVQKVCHEAVIHEVPGIQRGFQVPNDAENDTTRRVSTEGLNFRGMWERGDVIDVNSIYSNDIAAILRTYGVEAARNAIIQEVGGVFNVYGIGVDRRHLSLIADYMTFEGSYKPFNRMGIESNTSPFLKMSYEMTCKFLTHSTLYADTDTLKSPAARIVVGRVAEGGTGSFELYQPLPPTRVA